MVGCYLYGEQPIKRIFSKFNETKQFKKLQRLSRFLNVTYGIIGNTMQNNTIFASRKLTEQLSKTLQRKPEDVLCDIYSPYFFQYCPDYLKIVTLSLYYHFKYKLYWENNIIIESHLVRLPSHRKANIYPCNYASRRIRSKIYFSFRLV